MATDESAESMSMQTQQPEHKISSWGRPRKSQGVRSCEAKRCQRQFETGIGPVSLHNRRRLQGDKWNWTSKSSLPSLPGLNPLPSSASWASGASCQVIDVQRLTWFTSEATCSVKDWDIKAWNLSGSKQISPKSSSILRLKHSELYWIRSFLTLSLVAKVS